MLMCGYSEKKEVRTSNHYNNGSVQSRLGLIFISRTYHCSHDMNVIVSSNNNSDSYRWKECIGKAADKMMAESQELHMRITDELCTSMLHKENSSNN